MNVIASLEFELTYFDIAAQHVASPNKKKFSHSNSILLFYNFPFFIFSLLINLLFSKNISSPVLKWIY